MRLSLAQLHMWVRKRGEIPGKSSEKVNLVSIHSTGVPHPHLVHDSDSKAEILPDSSSPSIISCLENYPGYHLYRSLAPNSVWLASNE